MTSKLTIYNGALTVIGERKLQTLTDDVESRYKLDDVWDNEFLKRILQHGQWNFAARAVELQASTSTEPSFGYQFAFDKPTDYVRLMGIANDPYFKVPLTQYMDEAAWWFADIETIYVRYVSNDSQFGTDFSLWPANFTEYAEHYMAHKVAARLTGLSISAKAIKQKMLDARVDAKATDAMESPAKFPPKGSWAGSRQGFRSGERGSRNQLIG